MLDEMQPTNTIILENFNAQSPLWYCPDTDENGEKIQTLIEQHNLTVQNREGQPLTYMCRDGAGSYSDVTLTKGIICNCIHNWTEAEHATSSVHGVIYFDVDNGDNQTNCEAFNRNSKSIYNINK